ncbi:MAG TPA: pyridoxamine 5'-phosphate oxidase family protein, partial [Thermoanaerobaculia bacterium]
LRSLKNGVDACVTVTLLDGLVLARSAFHHSMNYRSVVVFGKAREVGEDEKIRVLDSLVEHVVRGRSAEVRAPNQKELRQTLVLALPIDEASAKIRTGGPVDDEEDYALPVWAGVLPLQLTPGAPLADDGVTSDVPEYLKNYTR